MKSNSTILIIILALILAGGGYWYYAGQTGNQPPLSASAGEGEAQTQFKTLVSELKNISFDKDIFSNPNFLVLTDLATEVMPETSGRLDPFAPLAGTSAKNEE